MALAPAASCDNMEVQFGIRYHEYAAQLSRYRKELTTDGQAAEKPERKTTHTSDPSALCFDRWSKPGCLHQQS